MTPIQEFLNLPDLFQSFDLKPMDFKLHNCVYLKPILELNLDVNHQYI